MLSMKFQTTLCWDGVSFVSRVSRSSWGAAWDQRLSLQFPMPCNVLLGVADRALMEEGPKPNLSKPHLYPSPSELFITHHPWPVATSPIHPSGRCDGQVPLQSLSIQL